MVSHRTVELGGRVYSVSLDNGLITWIEVRIVATKMRVMKDTPIAHWRTIWVRGKKIGPVATRVALKIEGTFAK